MLLFCDIPTYMTKKSTFRFLCKTTRIGKVAKQSYFSCISRLSVIYRAVCEGKQTSRPIVDGNIVARHDKERDESCLRRPVREHLIRARAHHGIPGKSGRTGRERRVSMRRSLPPRSKARRISTKKPLASGKRRMTTRGIKKRVAG